MNLAKKLVLTLLVFLLVNISQASPDKSKLEDGKALAYDQKNYFEITRNRRIEEILHDDCKLIIKDLSTENIKRIITYNFSKNGDILNEEEKLLNSTILNINQRMLEYKINNLLILLELNNIEKLIENNEYSKLYDDYLPTYLKRSKNKDKVPSYISIKVMNSINKTIKFCTESIIKDN